MWNRRFICLWAGQTLANLGDVFYIVAFISVMYAATNSVMYTAFIPVVNLTSQSLSSFLAPLVFQHLSLQRMLVLSQGLKTILLCIASFVVAMGVGEQRLVIWLLFGLAAMIAFMDGWANPARNALVPRLVDRSELMRANGLLATSDQTVHFAGWAAGGLLVAWLGASVVLLGTVGAYVVATVAMLGVAPAKDGKKEEDSQSESRQAKTSWLTGWRIIRDAPSLQLLVAMDIVVGMSGAAWISAILLPFVLDELGSSEAWWGYINAGYMLGAIAGGSVLLMLTHRLKRHLYKAIAIGTICSSLITFAFGSSTNPMVALLFSFLLGPFLEIFLVSKQTILQQQTEESALPYVLSAKGTIDMMVFGVSSLIMGAFAEILGTRAVYYLSAALLIVGFLLAWKLYQQANRQARATIS
ncbi:putative MFS-type transporter YfmI [Brevibacillus reuszeri]|uniref:MFS transporter n=1 Tax=Brevibacillus reuszeri TaxID=54915 RepID=UPI001B286A1B|nr:MFS transporter [Brevibacillus reuszeri]GIO10029.1 putative MFS-type transporter YfmI [Brevibacillus reuszeri]